MKKNFQAIILIFALICCASLAPSLSFAQDTNKTFYNKELTEDISIWRLRQKQLTAEEQKELDKYVEALSEARLKEQRAQTDLSGAEKKLADFVDGEKDKLEKEKELLQDQISRAERKVARIQENLDKAKQELESLQKGFDGSVAAAQAGLDAQGQKLEELIKEEQEKIEKTQKNTKNVSEKIVEFEKAINGKFKK